MKTRRFLRLSPSEALMGAEAEVDEFWNLALFRRALALGLELGSLPAALTV